MSGGTGTGSAPAPAPPAATAPTVNWLVNPFYGDINPGEVDGAKLYNRAIKAPSEELNIAQKNAQDIVDTFVKDASDFGWGALVENIEIDNAGNTKSILTEVNEISLEDVQKSARTTFGTLDAWNVDLPNDFIVRDINPASHNAQRPHFYCRVCSNMIAKRIERSLDPASLKTLNTDKRKFQWVATNGTIYNDGPTMLFLLMSKVNPSVRVGIAALKMNIQTATLPKFNHNLPKMVEYIQENHSQIV